MPWDQFKEKFKTVEYDSGYGGQGLASDLIVFLKDGCWLERHEYDGAEWWELKGKIVKNVQGKPFKVIQDELRWDILKEMNKGI
ncbi:hypothetical protein EJK17_09890 [Lactobacillus xujianguonis]|uniref:Uncharacterized protein n=1 Tax=Lactobacillus xujianguonis TaxID=2495899 RepID=A0A437SSW9_9LACO|nr:hypothetical protein [Lactobacillus xujianguonis]RVU70031.1 hypothetical protein EJK17_09890 [Lactobacillus xujianguonis]